MSSEVEKTLQAYIDACNAEDVEAYKATLAEDAVFCPPDQPPVEGREAIGEWIKAGFFDPFECEFDARFDRVVVNGSEAFTPGTFAVELKPAAGGEPIKVTGEFFNIFREQPDGTWKYSYAIFNFDARM